MMSSMLVGSSPSFLRPAKGLLFSVLLHLSLVLLAFDWFTQSRQTGVLPPAIAVQLALYQLEQVPQQQVALGQQQQRAMPEITQPDEVIKPDELPPLPIVNQGNQAPAVKKRLKPPVKKAEVTPEWVETPITAANPAPVTQAPAPGNAASSSATFNSATTEAISGRQQWLSQVHGHLAKFKRYPREAQRYRHTGVSQVIFVLDAQGYIKQAKILSSSGSQILDKSALATLTRAEPFPLPPNEQLVNGLVEVISPIAFGLPP